MLQTLTDLNDNSKKAGAEEIGGAAS